MFSVLLAAGMGAQALAKEASLVTAESVQESARRSTLYAQTYDTGCRQTNSATGVYVQPNLDSASTGILSQNQTVRLEVAGTGTGWARITEPLLGWLEARYLTPPTSCNGLSYPGSTGSQVNGSNSSIINTPPQSTPSQYGYGQQGTGRFYGDPNSLNNNSTPVETSNTGSSPVSVVCEVLPSEGLVVRSAPTSSGGTALYTIPKGVHTFQFTGTVQTSQTNDGIRRWAYILAPYEGWISLGYLGGGFNLGGRECG